MDLFGLGGIFQAVGDSIIGGLNYAEQKKYNEQMLALNREQFDYQKYVQQQTWQREDNAVQRRAEDLTKAGMNRLMAGGQSASAGGVVPTGSLTQGAGGAPQLQTSDALNMIMNALSTKQNIAQSKAQEDLLREEARNVNQNTKVQSEQEKKTRSETAEIDAKKQKIMSEISLNDALIELKKQEQQINEYNYDWSKHSGIRTTDKIPSGLTESAWIAGQNAGRK